MRGGGEEQEGSGEVERVVGLVKEKESTKEEEEEKMGRNGEKKRKRRGDERKRRERDGVEGRGKEKRKK